MPGLLDLLAQNFPSLFGAPAPVRPRSLLDTTATNPVGTSSIYPPQVMTNPDPNVSPVVDRATMTPQALWGALLSGNKRNVTAAELPALENKANTAVDYGMAVAGATQPIRAFHGSPHTFDRFDLSKIGTGEGAQAYGHGLYFAENPEVARGYRMSLEKGNPSISVGKQSLLDLHDKFMAAGDMDKARAIEFLHDGGDALYVNSKAKFLPPETLAWFNQEIAPNIKRTGGGSMYEVNLRTSPERLLDWDKPLSAQPQQVREALANTLPPYETKNWGGLPHAFANKKMIEIPSGEVTGREAYILARMGDGGDDFRNAALAATERLRNAGVDGIQYLDAGSRAAGDGTRNYVMFRDDIIDILRRYGLLGMVGGGAGAGLLAPGADQ